MTIFKWDPMTDTHRFLLNDVWSSKVMRDGIGKGFQSFVRFFEFRCSFLNTLF